VPEVVVEASAPPVEAVAGPPVVIEAPALPVVVDAPAPPVEEAAVLPVVVEGPAPLVEESAMPPVVIEAPAPPVEEVAVPPVVDIVPEEAACAALPPPVPEPFESAAYSGVWPQAAAPLSDVMPETAVQAEPDALPPPLPGPPPLPELTQPASLDETAELARVILFPIQAEHSESASAGAEPLFAATPKGPRMQWALLGGTAAGIVAGVLAIWLATGK
jgi:hypothetical protein